MEDGSFWNDPVVSQNKMKTLKSLKDDVATYEKLATQFEDIETLIEMGYEENDASLIPEIEEMLSEFVTTFDNIRIKTLLSGEYDGDNAILSLHAGAGGTESCDWAQMLFRMYSKWADSRGYELVVLDSLDGDEAGIKSITFQINGENAYGYLKSEKGVHRLVRISPFNAAGKRQTSFVSCDVMPDIEEDVDVEIREEDIRIDTFRSSGAGGCATAQEAQTLLERALEVSDSTNGIFDCTIEPVMDAWGFTTQNYRVPSADELQQLLSRVDYKQVRQNGSDVSIPADVQVDLGGIAKGYTSDRIMQVLADNGVTSGIVSLGGNVQALGCKPDV